MPETPLTEPWGGKLSEYVELARAMPERTSNHFQLARLILSVDSDDPEFADRFSRIFSECSMSISNADNVDCHLVIRFLPEFQVTLIRIDDSIPTDCLALLGTLYASHTSRELPAQDGWRVVYSGDRSSGPVLAFKGEWIVVDSDQPWQLLIANLVLANIMRLQSELCFFHGATIAVGDAGVMLSGQKGAGKTTLSLALADRGHGFLTDEYATVEIDTGLLIPFRRAVSIRQGPQSRGVREYLTSHDGELEVLPDGTTRRRVLAGEMLPNCEARSTVLTHAFFLVGFGEKPFAQPIELGVQHLALMELLTGSQWGYPALQRAFHCLKIFSGASCFLLTAGGTPEETAAYIENIVGNHRGETSLC
jgi:hypothetical protein